MQSIPIVYDVHVWVLAAIGADSTYPRVPAIPPSTGNPSADCLSVAFDAEEFAVWISPHILENTARVLREYVGTEGRIEAYIDFICDIVDASGGQIVDPPRTAFDSPDHEDNLILDLVVASDALILVSDDTDLTPLSPWKGRMILRPLEFVEHVVQLRRKR